MSKVTASTDFDRVPENEAVRYITIFSEQVANILNKNVSFGDNINGVLLTCTFSSANADGNYTHNLGRTPSGYIVCGTTVAMNVFDGSVAATASVITLQASAAGTAKIYVF